MAQDHQGVAGVLHVIVAQFLPQNHFLNINNPHPFGAYAKYLRDVTTHAEITALVLGLPFVFLFALSFTLF